jgi:hypothetical protein
MKHQSISLVKFKTLAMRLKLPQWQAVGLLESLWLFAQHNARDGVLSRYTAEEFAAWIEWGSDPNELMEALIATRWIDRDGDELVIHDWNQHQPNWLKGVTAHRTPSRQPSTAPSRQPSSQPGTAPSSQPSAEPAPLPPNLTQPNLTKPKRNIRTQFSKPAIAEVAAYCRERNNRVDPETFMDYYESNGWRIGGKAPMRDWKATVRRWEKTTHNARAGPRDKLNANMDQLNDFLAKHGGDDGEQASNSKSGDGPVLFLESADGHGADRVLGSSA